MLMLREQLVVVASDRVSKRQSGYWCNRHAAPLIDEVRPRSLWIYGWGTGAGFGKVAQVRHLYCPDCYPDWKPPNEDGAEGIYTIQLIDVNEDLFPTGLLKDLETRAMQLMRER